MPQYVGGGTATSSFYHPTPSPADSGVMSPMTPGSSCGTAGLSASAGAQPPRHPSMTSPEQLSSSSSTSSGSPYFSHPSPADSGFACSSASPYAMTSPASTASCGQHETVAATTNNLYENMGSSDGNDGGALQPPQCPGHSSAMGSATQMQKLWALSLHMPRHQHRERTYNVRKLGSESGLRRSRECAVFLSQSQTCNAKDFAHIKLIIPSSVGLVGAQIFMLFSFPASILP